MWKLSVQKSVDFAHALSSYPGKCARVHGHTWLFTLTVYVRNLNDLGMGIDYKDLKEILGNGIEGLDHRLIVDSSAPVPNSLGYSVLNAVKVDYNPTSENLAKFVYQKIKPQLSGMVEKFEISVSETPGVLCTYSEDTSNENSSCR